MAQTQILIVLHMEVAENENLININFCSFIFHNKARFKKK